MKKSGYECHLIDAPASNKSFSEILQEIKDKKFQLVIVDTSTPSILNDCQIALKLKKHFDAYTVIVGTHPSALPEESLELVQGVDSAARCEYEMTLCDLAKCLEKNPVPTLEELKKIDGLSFFFNGDIYHNNDRELNNNLDSLPFVSSAYKTYLNHKDYQ